MPGELPTREISVVPANQASCEDLDAVFGKTGEAAACQCQWFKVPRAEFASLPASERVSMLREQTACGRSGEGTTTGLVAYMDGEPVGWCAVEPRVAYPRLLAARIPWAGRSEDKEDPDVWSATCFVTRPGYRRQRVSYALASATVEHARRHGARAVEAYPLDPDPGQEFGWGEMYVGSRSVFEAAGYVEVAKPSRRRVVMRLDFD